MYSFHSLLVILLAFAFPASAQDIRWELIETGILNHASHGQGIEMRIKPEPVPAELFDGDGLVDLMSGLCNHYAPSVIQYVQEKTGIEQPEFIAVRIVTGGAAGRYVLQAFEISDGKCGKEL